MPEVELSGNAAVADELNVDHTEMEKFFSTEFELEGIDSAAGKLLSSFAGHRIFAFYGDLGSGKTTFIKALCRRLGIAQTITSPTFALINEYSDNSSGNSYFHFDFYRVENIEEALDLGYEDYFYGDNSCFIEWPEKVEDLLPPETVRLRLDVLEDGRRRLSEMPQV